MTPQKQPRTDIHDRQTLRTKQSDTLELLIAASEAGTGCADWLVDLRSQTGGHMS